MGILVEVRLHPSFHGYPGSMPDSGAETRHQKNEDYLIICPGGEFLE
jgi:hypothetical protein